MDTLHDYGTGEAPRPPRSFPADHRRKWRVEPTSFHDLLERAGPYADATRTHVEWGAVTSWLMKGEADKALDAAILPGEAATNAVFHTRQAVEHEAGWPQLSDKRVSPVLYDLPADLQCKVRSMAAEVRSLWEAAGRPHLDSSRFKDAYRYLVACVRKGIIPDALTMGELPPLMDAKPHPILDF